MWLPQGCEEHLSLFIFAGSINHVRNPFYTENISHDIYISYYISFCSYETNIYIYIYGCVQYIFDPN